MNWADAARQIRGAFRLGQRNPAGLADLDTSLDGYWRSFWAALLVLPSYVAMVVTEPPSTLGYGPLAGFLADAIAYVVFWTSMPVLMLHVTRLFDRQQRYTAYVVADNWAQIPQTYLMSLVSVVGYADLLSDGLQSIFGLVAVLWILVFKFWVARLTLDIRAGQAMAIVMLDIAVGLMISSFTNRIGG